MRLIKITFVSVMLLFGCMCAYSQEFMLNLPPTVILQDIDISLDDDEDDDDDGESIDLDWLISQTALGIIDSTTIPAARLYNNVWNNSLVNPYKANIASLLDTFKIDLSQYCHPNKNVVTSDFGFRRGVRFHYGIDTRLTTGDSICSSFDGMVRIVHRGKAYGNYIVIRHFNGLETVYAHLSKNLVRVNQIVRAGEIIGLGGSTGRSTGPHLHYEVRFLGQPIAPRSLIDFDNYTALSASYDFIPEKQFSYVKTIEQVRYYTVRKGDTLSAISRKVGVSVDKLCQLNRIKRTSTLRIGQRIRYS